MPLNGSGSYAAPASSWNPAVTVTAVNSTDWNALLADLTTALSTALYKDGQQTPTANLPMGGFKFTGLGAGNAAGNSLRYEQLFTSGTLTLLGPLTTGGVVTMAATTAVNETKTTVASATTPDIWTSTGNVIDYTGTVTATGFAAAPQAGSRRALVCAGAAVFTAGANVLIQGVASGSNYTATAGDIITVVAITTTQFRLFINPVTGIPGKQPTRQVLTSGTGATYTTPSGATRINVRMVGGGGGGAAQVTNSGAAGTSTTFGTLTAANGTGGAPAAGASGTGGAGTNGDINITGQSGVAGTGNVSAALGGTGGSSILGGAGIGGNTNAAGGNAQTNSGSGGGGGGGDGATTTPGSGGGAGAYVEKLILTPSATYTYTVGAGGNGGAAGTRAGGNGAAGIIIVDEFYN